MEREQQAKQLLEMEREMMLCAQKVKLYDNSMQNLQRNKARCMITQKELQGLGEDHRLFRPLGRAFVLRPKKQISEELDLVIKNNDRDIAQYKEQRETFYKKTADLDKKLEEAVKKFQASKK